MQYLILLHIIKKDDFFYYFFKDEKDPLFACKEFYDKSTEWIPHITIFSIDKPRNELKGVERLSTPKTKQQLKKIEGKEDPDYVIACVGGGSNAAGLFYPFLDNEKVKIICVEAAGKGVNSGESAATSVLGKEGIIHGSKTLLMQSDDGQITEPYSISAGLDYPGIGPMHANLYKSKRGEFISIDDKDAMRWGLILSQTEGIIPAIETSHAFAVLDKKKFDKNDVIVFNCSGRGDKDLETYIEYFKL